MKTFKALAFIAIAAVVCSCGGGKEDKPDGPITPSVVAVTSVSLSKTESELVIGNTLQLTATVYPSNATEKNITWNSSNTTVATVTPTGLVTAKAAGTAEIIALSANSGIKATCKITVTTDNTNVLPCEITYKNPNHSNAYNQYVLDYDGNGVIKSFTHFETGDSWTYTRRYDFTITSSTLVETYQTNNNAPEIYSKTLSNGYVKSSSYPYGGIYNGYSWGYEYNNGYLKKATTTIKGYGLMGKEELTWNNNCLTKITNEDYYTDGDIAFSSRVELTYGSDSNPYFGKNFDPMALLLYDIIGVLHAGHDSFISGHDSFEEMMVGLLGHNGKTLPKSAKWVSGSNTKTYSFTYKFSNGGLTYVKITPADPSEGVYEYNIKNKSFK